MSRLPGASCVLTAALLTGGIAPAQDAGGYATAQEAVAARAWQVAAQIWRREAEQGRAEAYLGLGNLWDLGALGHRDQSAALDYYRKAAEAGLPAAAFNVGAMIATGPGTQRDMAAAASWYARAALAGHDRAAFALGRLHAAGAVLPANADIAAGWLEQAARTIPAAADALARLETDADGVLNAPAPLVFQLQDRDETIWAQMAWSAAPGPSDAEFRVEIAEHGPDGRPSALIATTQARGGFARLPIPFEVSRVLWRVVMVDRDAADYAASAWHDPETRQAASKPAGLVTFRTSTDSDRARNAAQGAAESLRVGFETSCMISCPCHEACDTVSE